MQDDDLDRLLTAASRRSPSPSPALIESVLADALALQPAPRAAVATPRPAPGLLERLFWAFGGAPSLAGIGSAAVIGMALGYMNPTALDSLGAGFASSGSESVELFPDADFALAEAPAAGG